MEDKFYTLDEVAERMQITKRTVQRLIKAGKLKSINLGVGKRPVIRVWQKELDRFVSEQYEGNL